MQQFSAVERDVLSVIEAAHRAFWLKDIEGFERRHLNADHHIRWAYWQAGGMSLRRGWDEIGPRSREHMLRLDRPLPEFAEAPMENLCLRVGTDMAWASFDQTFPYVPEIFGQGPNGTLHMVNILEHHGGEWKIAGNCLFDAHLGHELIVRVDQEGRLLWASTPAAERLRNDRLFVLRHGYVRLRHNTQDAKLRNALRAVGDTNDRLMPERRSLPLLLEDSESGQIRTVWVFAENGETYVMLDDRRPMETRLAQAALVYNLSPAQLRLAGAVCMGLSLPDFSRQSGVSQNTARTHLKRLFDKVGVSSQPLLVRALLSLAPPR